MRAYFARHRFYSWVLHLACWATSSTGISRDGLKTVSPIRFSAIIDANDYGLDSGMFLRQNAITAFSLA